MFDDFPSRNIRARRGRTEALPRRLIVRAFPAETGAGADAEPARPHGMPTDASDFVLRVCANISILTGFAAPCIKDRRLLAEGPSFTVSELKVDVKGWLREATGRRQLLRRSRARRAAAVWQR